MITNEEANTAIELCEILKKEIEKAQILNENSDISNYLTISAGIVSKIPETIDDIDSITKLLMKDFIKQKN